MARRPAPPRQPRSRLTGLTVGQAAGLGLIQGPAELLPVSSSGHLVLVPALLGWPYARLDAADRKAFEVSLHAGAGLALAWLMRTEIAAALADPLATALLAAPAAAAGAALEPLIEERLSDPRVAAVAQIASGAALALADRGQSLRENRPNRGQDRGQSLRENGADPHQEGSGTSRCALLAIGAAQAAALVPGVSRNGATLTAARALGFGRAEASRLSWRAGLPVIAGAVALKGFRLARGGLDRDLRTPFAAGAAAAFASTLAAAPLVRLTQRPYLPLGAYRAALGAFALRRLHRLQWQGG